MSLDTVISRDYLAHVLSLCLVAKLVEDIFDGILARIDE